MTLRREVRFEPGYDYRTEDASKPAGQRRGCHGMTIRFLLHGDDGSVQFVMYTDWLPSHVVDKGDMRGPRVDRSTDPSVYRLANRMPKASDLGYHWRTEPYKGCWRPEGVCEFLGDAQCFYDGSGLNAEPVMAELFTEGDAGVWRVLEDFYISVQRDANGLHGLAEEER